MPSDLGNDKGDKLLGIEVFYADRALETFGRDGSGWFWRSRRRGFSPAGLLLAHLLRAIHHIAMRKILAGADLSVAQVFLSGSHLGGWRTANLEMLCHQRAISHNRRGARKHSLRGKCPVIQGTRVDRRECRELYILVFSWSSLDRVCRKSLWA